jgi:hypothetical protein
MIENEILAALFWGLESDANDGLDGLLVFRGLLVKHGEDGLAEFGEMLPQRHHLGVRASIDDGDAE